MIYKAIAEYYDPENEHQPMLQQDVPFFLGHLERRQALLELAVGTARAAIPIAQAGHRVVGVDNDPLMLKIAKRKRDFVGLTDRQLELVRADMRKVDLGRTFDWTAVFFNTFLVLTSLQDQDACLQTCRRHLKRGGHLFLDIFQPNLPLLAQEISRNLEPIIFFVPGLNRTVVKMTDIRCEPAAQLQHVTFHYTWFDAAGTEHREARNFDLTFIFPRELRILLERNGFELLRMYGNYDGSKLDADSPRIIVVARNR